MHKTAALYLALALWALSPLPSHAAKVYKWTDEKGQVHYGEAPPPGSAKEIELERSPPAPAPAPQTTAPAGNGPKQGETAAQQIKEARELAAKNCETVKTYMQSLKQGGRLYEQDAKGERHYFTEEELAAKQKEAEESMKKWCSEE